MKIVNLIWGFALGGGIDKCFVRYAALENVDASLKMINVCISLKNKSALVNELYNLNVKFITINSRMDFSWIKAICSIFKEEKPDVLFTHGFNGAIISGILKIVYKCWPKKEKKNIRMICTYHGLYSPMKWSRKFVAPLFNFLPILVYRFFCYKVICVSECSKDELLKRSVPKQKICVVYNGVENDDFLESFSSKNLSCKVHSEEKVINNPLVIIVVARLSHEKGLVYLIKALNLLNKEGKNFICNVFGNGPDYEFLNKLIIKYNLVKCVFLKGYSNDISKELLRSDIYVSSSIYEAHSLSILEAMKAEIAIVATDISKESVRHLKEGLLVPCEDYLSLSNSLRVLLIDKDLRCMLGKNARSRFLKKFTTHNMFSNLIKVLES